MDIVLSRDLQEGALMRGAAALDATKQFPADRAVPTTSTQTVSSRASTRVPVEVQERIAGFMKPGSSGAYAAALVCRAWYPFAIKVFYEEVLFWSRRRVAILMRLVLTNPRVKAQLAVTRKAEFHQYSFLSTFPHVFAKVLPSLTEIVITGLSGPLHPSFIRVLRSFSSVDRLDLTTLWVVNFHELRRLISALPNLKSLEITNVNFGRKGSPLGTPLEDMPFWQTSVPNSTRLQELWISLRSMGGQPNKENYLIRWLANSSLCESLSQLTLSESMSRRRTAEDFVEQVNHLLRTIGPALKVLRLTDACISQYDLSHNVNLTHVEFALLPAFGWQSFADRLRGVLKSIPSLRMTSISITHMLALLEDQPVPDATALKPLHETLRSPAYARITGANFSMLVMSSSGGWESEFNTILAPW
ncbi:uncharacterized protein B0H18DRAFT_1107163, partial [Fomitopsis serialis]|uniref:uncharacterized protein n=1 Tax=Fomitopsis serialis TaxID=139415 RepID=UPI0020083E7A